MKTIYFLLLNLLVFSARADLSITTEKTETTGDKTVVPLKITNRYSETVESARAVVFLLDDDGKLVAQKATWIIGGTNEKAGLAANASTNYNVVLQTDRPFSSSKVTVTRVILAGGKLADLPQPKSP